MPLPKRIYLEGYPYFITNNVFKKIPILSISGCSNLLLRNIDIYRQRYGFKLLGYSILPCHWYCIILPKKPGDISDIMRDIKSYTHKIVFGYLEQNKDVLKFKFKCGRNCRCQLYNYCRGAETAATRSQHFKDSKGRNTPLSGAVMLLNLSPHVAKTAVRRRNLSPRVEQVPVPTRSEISHRGSETAATRENEIIYKINNRQVINSPCVEQVPVPAKSEVSLREYNDRDILNLLKIGKLWQRGFYDHLIRNEQDFREKLNYINYNAVKHGLVKDPKDWKYSSFHNYEFNDHSIIKIDRIDL